MVDYFSYVYEIGLDLINMILKQSGNAIVYGKEAHQVIKKEMIPILASCFEPKSNDFLGCRYSHYDIKS